MEVYIAIIAGFFAGLTFRFILFKPKHEETIVLADITGIVVGSIVAGVLFALIVDSNANRVQVIPAVVLVILLTAAFRFMGNFSQRNRRRKTDLWRSDSPRPDHPIL